MLAPLYLVYACYTFFILRRLWAYCRDQSPLNQQVDDSHQPRFSRKIRAWLMHLNFWEIGALSWLPVLWGREKPFVCTPKQNYIQSRQSLLLKNIAALPKLLLVLNIITVLVVAPFSPLYSPVLFICAVAVCILKLSAAKVAMNNFSDARADMPSMSKVLKQTLKVAHEKKTTITTSYATSLFKDKKTIDS